jgi:ribonucleoside-diphosphate reductase alpha chain
LSSCFILSTKDNIEDICKLDAEFAKIFQQNGGAGTDLSVLRPMKSAVNASKGYAGGVVTFMEKYDATADQMTRYNPSRKGALKINLQVWHPDIFLFIHAKDDLSKLNRMNISISLTDSFMQAVKNDEQWDLEFPDYENNKSVYDKEWDGDLDKWKSKNYPVKKYQTIKASKLLKEISECAWKSGEPGFNFQDTMDKDNPNKHLGTKVYTNP